MHRFLSGGLPPTFSTFHSCVDTCHSISSRAVVVPELLRASKEVVFISKGSKDSIFMARKFNLTVSGGWMGISTGLQHAHLGTLELKRG